MAIQEFKRMKKIIFGVILLFSNICFAQQQPGDPAKGAGKVLDFDDSTKITELFFSGLGEKAKLNAQQAGNYFKQIIEIDPANDAALFELANIYHTQNQEKEAERLVRAAISVNPNNEWFWLLLADIYKKTNNLPQLNLVFDELIKLAPQKEEYYFDKATALLDQNKVDEALAIYDMIEKKHGLSDDLTNARQRIYQKQGKTDKAAVELEKLVKSDPSDVSNYIELGQLYYNSGDKDKALQILLQAKSADPGNAFVRITLADLYRSQGKTEESYAELKSAFESSAMSVDAKIRIILSLLPQFKDAKGMEEATTLAAILVQTYPANAKVHAIYGDILFQQKKQTEALKSYKKALELDNQNYIIWENAIQIEVSASDFDSAIKDGEEALTVFPNQAGIYLYTGMAYAQKKNHEKAVSYLKNAASLETEDKGRQVQIYSALGDSYNALKNYPESDKAYEKALQMSPDNTYTLNNYAYYLSLRGENLDKAEQMSHRSNDKEPNNGSFEDTYAWILFRQKKYKEARTWIEKAIKDNKGNNTTLAEHYGDILIQLGDTDLAVQQWTKAKNNGVKTEKLDRKINEKKYIE